VPEDGGSAQSEVVELVNPAGAGAALIVCEHASNHIPDRYDGLGLGDKDRDSHVAWDPGARDVALGLSRALDAPLLAARISRLVYDCNRPPDAPDAIPERSETIEVPGNRGLTSGQRQERIGSVYQPFCNAVSELIAARGARGTDLVLITVHSFTPVYFGKSRAVEIGILHDADSRLADAMLAGAPALPHRRIERNRPYGPEDGVTHTLKLHGLPNHLQNVMIEIRNDLLQSRSDVARITGELLELICPAFAAIGQEAAQHA